MQTLPSSYTAGGWRARARVSVWWVGRGVVNRGFRWISASTHTRAPTQTLSRTHVRKQHRTHHSGATFRIGTQAWAASTGSLPGTPSWPGSNRPRKGYPATATQQEAHVALEVRKKGKKVGGGGIRGGLAQVQGHLADVTKAHTHAHTHTHTHTGADTHGADNHVRTSGAVM